MNKEINCKNDDCQKLTNNQDGICNKCVRCYEKNCSTINFANQMCECCGRCCACCEELHE